MVKLVSFLYASSALGDRAFLFPRGQRIAAYTESSGILTKLWSKKLKSEISSSGSTAGNSCLIGTEEDELISIDFRTGDINWKFQADGYIIFPPVAYKGMIYFAAENTVYCLSGSGEEVWKNDLGGRISSPLKIDRAKNRVLVTLFNEITIDTQHHDLVCLKAKTGETFARRMSKKIFRSAVMIGKSNFFVLTSEDLRKFGRGELKATAPAISKVPPATGEIFGEMDLLRGRLIYQSQKGGVVYDVNERKVLLKFAFDITTDVVVCPLLNIFFFGIKKDGLSKVCAIEAESLTVKWTTEMQASLSNPPVLTNEAELIVR